MQFLKVAHELITDINITSNEFRIYSYLLSLYNKAKKCSYPSIEVISKKTNISISTVKRSIKNLEKLGYLKVTKRAGISGNYNEYSEFKFLISDEKVENTDSKKNQILTKNKVKEIPVKKEFKIEKNDTEEIETKKSEEVEVKQHPNNSRIAKETKIKLTPFYCEAFSHIDEGILDMALKEKAKSACLLLIKCIRLTKQVGLDFCKEFINKVLKFDSYKNEWELTIEDNTVYRSYIDAYCY